MQTFKQDTEMPAAVQSWKTVVEHHRLDFQRQIEDTGYKAPNVPKNVLNLTKIPLDEHLTEHQLRITEQAPEVLVARLAAGEYTSVEVTEAFCRRAIIAHELTNCLNQIFFDNAMARAAELDAYFKETGKVVGPLHGLPISLKNQVALEGIEMNMDYVGWVGRIADKSAVLAQLLAKQGAVFYVLTNMSQSMFSSDSVNNLYGRTVNPYNKLLCSGGSSGGEGAIVAMKGSPLGVGTDIGGSVRIPAGYNKLFGFRPSGHRIPYAGAPNSQEGQEATASVLGPLSPSVGGLKLFFKSVLDAKPWNADPLALRMPWNESMYQLEEHGSGKEPLCFALMLENGQVRPDPPYWRAMEMTKKALLAAGHKVIDWALPDQAEGNEVFTKIFLADGGADVRAGCATSGEPVFGGLLRDCGDVKGISAYEFWQVCKARRDFVARQLEAWMATESLTGSGRPVDAIITPVAPYPSFRHGDTEYCFYTGISNLCDYPASTFPVTQVDPEVDVKWAAHDFASAFDKEVFDRYDPEVYRDAPIGLQVIGRKGEDEAVLRMTEIVAEALVIQ